MEYDDVMTRNGDGQLAVRTVETSGDNYVNPDDVYTRDGDGKLCIRIVGSGGAGGTHNLGLFEDLEALQEAHPTGNAGDYALLASTDTFWTWDSETSAWVDTDRKGQVESVNGRTGAVTGVQDVATISTVATATLTQELANNTIYNCGEMTSLTLTLPASLTADWVCQLNFTSGTTPTSLTAPVTIKWKGDDLTADVFVPVESKRYAVLFFYDGVSVRGIVQGIA